MRRRRSGRLTDFDYSQQGAYFITICTYDRFNFFGKIQNGEVILSPMGKTVEKSWLEIPEYYIGIEVDHFVIMPNHIHGIVIVAERKESCRRV